MEPYNKRNVMKLYGAINRDIKDVENYHTGLMGEALIVASYKQMTIDQLVKLRFIINKIVQKKKAYADMRAPSAHNGDKNEADDITGASTGGCEHDEHNSRADKRDKDAAV